MVLYRLIVIFAVMGAALAVTAARAGDTALFARHDPASKTVIGHQAFKEFLAPIHYPGADGIDRIDYGAVTPDAHAALKTYIAKLEAVRVTGLSRKEQFAFWANLYNAVTLDVILDHYPVESIRDITNGLFSFGPWKVDRVKVEGVFLSLDDIEHGILRTHWRDPRVHYAVNCASIGCPNLSAEPLSGADLDSMLDANARAFVNHPRGAHLDRKGRLSVSRIYKWFQEDFGGNRQGVLDHLGLYANDRTKAMLAKAGGIGRYHYDWSLNDTKTSGNE